MSHAFVPPSLPSIQIELAIEAAPRIRIVAMNEGEERRLMDWLCSHERLADLIQQALELADEEHAA